MNEEYLRGLHEHLGIKDDYDTWIEAITNNEEYLQGLHKHLKVKDDYETWTNAVFGEVKKKDESVSISQEEDTEFTTPEGQEEVISSDVSETISPQEESEFQNWMATDPNVVAWREEFKQNYGEEPQIDNSNYDYRGAWKAGIKPQPSEVDGMYHWGSKGIDGVDLKSEDHPTRWKSEYMDATGINPDESGITKEEALEVISKSVETDLDDISNEPVIFASEAERYELANLTDIEKIFGRSAIPQFFGDLYRSGAAGQAQGGSVDESLELFYKGAEVTDEDIQDFLAAQERMQAHGESTEMEDFQRIYKENGGGFLGFTLGVANNLSVIPQLFVSSVSAMLTPATLAGAASGAGAGAAIGSSGFTAGPLGAFTTAGGALVGAMGGASATLETGLTFAELLQEEIGDEKMTIENIREVLEDPDKVNNMRFKAAGRGFTIGAIDAYTGGLAANITSRVAKTTGRKLVAAGAGGTVEAIGGSTGEVGGKLVAGQEMDVADILFEGVTGTATAPISVGMGLYRAPKYHINGTDKNAQVSGPTMAQFIRDASPSDLLKAEVNIENDPVLKQVYDDRYNEVTVQREILAAEPNMNKPTLDAITSLQLELNTLEGNKTQAAKDRAAIIKAQIKSLIENPIQEGEARSTQISVDGDNTSTSTIVVTEDYAIQQLAEEGIENPTLEQVQEKQQQIIKEQRNAIQEQSTEGVDASEQTGPSEGVREGDTESGLPTEQTTQEGTESVQESDVEQTETQTDTDTVEESDVEQMMEDTESVAEEDVVDPAVEEEVSNMESDENVDLTPIDEADIDLVEPTNVEVDPSKGARAVVDEDVVADDTVIEDTSKQDTAVEETTEGDVVVDDTIVEETTDTAVDVRDTDKINSILERVDETKKAIVNQAVNAINTLKNIFPDIEIVVHETTDSYNNSVQVPDTRGEFSYQIDEDGTKSGGRIDINLETARPETVAHEVAHAVLLKAFNDSVETYNNFKGKISQIISEADNKALQEFADNYEGDVVSEEYLAELVATLVNESKTLSPSTIQKIAQAINNIVSQITNGQVVPFQDVNNTQEILDFFNTISQNIAEGEAIQSETIQVDNIKVLDNGTNPIGNPTEIVKPKTKSKEQKNTFKKSHDNSLVKPEHKIDFLKLVDNIVAKKEKVWFWVADQLGINNELDGGPSFAHQKDGEIWASSMSAKAIGNNINKANYIFIISGSPTTSLLFNKTAYDKITSKLGDFNVFKETVLKANPTKALRETLEAHDSWQSLREDSSTDKPKKFGTGRKKFLIALEKTKSTPNTEVTKFIESINGYTDLNDLRDGFYKDNNFEQNDVMLVLKPEGVSETSNHSTYENTILGEVVGVPDVKVDALQLMPKEMADKYAGKGKSQASQGIAPYGSGVKEVSSPKRVAKSQRNTPAAKLAQQYNMNESGFMGKGIVNIPLLKRKAAALGLGVKQAVNGSYFFTKNGRKFNPFTVTRSDKSSINPIKKFVRDVRGLGYSEVAIETLLKRRGIKAEVITEVMTTEKKATQQPKTTMSEELVPGYDRLNREIKGIVEKSKKRGVKFLDIANNVINYVKGSKVYEIATDVQREKMLRDIRKEYNLKEKSAPSIKRILGLADDTITVKVKDLIKEQLRAAQRGAKDAKSFIKEAQEVLAKEVEDLVKKGTISNVQAKRIINRFAKTDVTKETQIDSFVEYMTNVYNKSETQYKKGIIGKIQALIEAKAKVTKTPSNKRRGKGLDAQGQSFFAAARAVIRGVLDDSLNAESIQNKLFPNIDDILTKSEADLTTKEQAQLDAYEAYNLLSDIENMSVEDVEALLDDLKKTRSESIARLQQKLEAERAEIKKLKDTADSNIKEGYSALYDSEGNLLDANQLNAEANERYKALMSGKLLKAFKLYMKAVSPTTPVKMIQSIANWLKHLGTLTNGLDKVGNFFTKNVYERLNKMESKYTEGVQKTRAKLDDIAKSIEGIKSYNDIKRKLATGVHKISGITTGLGKALGSDLFSADQLMRVYALSKNPVQRAKLLKQGFTDAKIEEIKKILGPEVIEFTDKVVDYLSNEYFEQTNDVYKDVNNVNLGYVEEYFPTQTIQQKVNAQLLQDGDFNGVFNAQTAPALKERTDQTGDVDILGADFTSVLDNHFETIERYKAYAKGVKILNNIFKFKSVDTLLSQLALTSAVKNAVNYAVNPNGAPSAVQASFLDKLMTKYTGFALAFKAVQIVKQATSFVNAFEDYNYRGEGKKRIPGLDAMMFMIDTAKVIATLPYQMKKAYDMSPMFRERLRKGLEGDVYGLESGSSTFKPIGKSHTLWGRASRAFKTAAGSPTVLGDILGVMGYMINYNRDIANGMSEAEALEKFENYNATQQSRRGTDKIPLQMNTNALARGFTMFGSTLFLQMNKVMQSMTNLMRSGTRPSAKDARALVLNLGVANVLFVTAANMFKFMEGEDEDKEEVLEKMKEAMMGLNLIYQIPYFGAGAEKAINRYKGAGNKPVDVVVDPISSVVQKAEKLVKEGDVSKGSRVLLELAIGAQLDPFIGLYEGFNEGFDDDVMYDILGVSKSYRPSEKKKQSLKDISRELKKVDPKQWNKLFGPNTKMGKQLKKQQQQEKKLKDMQRKAEEKARRK